jgi:hypothetical protein
VTECLKLATEMMCAHTGFHADQTRRHVRQPGFNLATRPLLTQHDGAAIVQPYEVWNEFLPISMPTTVIALLRFWDMACSLSLAPLASFDRWRGRSTAGPFHYRTSF